VSILGTLEHFQHDTPISVRLLYSRFDWQNKLQLQKFKQQLSFSTIWATQMITSKLRCHALNGWPMPITQSQCSCIVPLCHGQNINSENNVRAIWSRLYDVRASPTPGNDCFHRFLVKCMYVHTHVWTVQRTLCFSLPYKVLFVFSSAPHHNSKRERATEGTSFSWPMLL
jgi:hypothetical protein